MICSGFEMSLLVVIILITPAIASLPYRVDCAPLQISMRSMLLVANKFRSKSLLMNEGSFTGIPSSRTRVLPPEAPRVKIVCTLPALLLPPFTVIPTCSWSRVAKFLLPIFSKSALVITVTTLPVVDCFCAILLAVTTTSSSVLVSCCALTIFAENSKVRSINFLPIVCFFNLNNELSSVKTVET